MERYKKIVLEAPEGNAFVVSQEDSGELRIKLIPTTVTKYGDYTNPPIPEGWEHVEGEWNNGFVIQDSKENQFTWVPVGFLDSNGTIDGINFSEKFGRRNYHNDDFSDDGFNEKMEIELHKQWKSVKKYGGFYISRYNISKNKQTGKAQSVKGEMPLRNIDWNNSMKVAKTFGDGVSVTSHLPFGAEYDSTLEWFLKSGARTEEEIESDSTEWGNFCNTQDSPLEVVKTGTRDEWSTNHICDLAGNVDEWTQEQNKTSRRVIRGGDYQDHGLGCPVAWRFYDSPDACYGGTGFRAVLYIA